MSSTRQPRATARVAGALRTGAAEKIYNALLAVLATSAVALFIAGGASSSMQGLWTIALTASAALAVLFVGHRILTRDR